MTKKRTGWVPAELFTEWPRRIRLFATAPRRRTSNARCAFHSWQSSSGAAGNQRRTETRWASQVAPVATMQSHNLNPNPRKTVDAGAHGSRRRCPVPRSCRKFQERTFAGIGDTGAWRSSVAGAVTGVVTLTESVETMGTPSDKGGSVLRSAGHGPESAADLMRVCLDGTTMRVIPLV